MGRRRERGARRGQGGHTPACGHSTSCQRGGCAPHSRQVWAAPCQQPKINKILSAPNLLKHIHLAVPGKERREGGRGGRVSAGPFPQAGGDLSFLPRVLSAHPRPGALGGGAPGARVGAPVSHTGPTPRLGPPGSPATHPRPPMSHLCYQVWGPGPRGPCWVGGQVCAKEPCGERARPGAGGDLTRTQREGGRGAPRVPPAPGPPAACPAPGGAGACGPCSTRDSSPLLPGAG